MNQTCGDVLFYALAIVLHLTLIKCVNNLTNKKDKTMFTKPAKYELS